MDSRLDGHENGHEETGNRVGIDMTPVGVRDARGPVRHRVATLRRSMVRRFLGQLKRVVFVDLVGLFVGVGLEWQGTKMCSQLLVYTRLLI